MSQGCGSCNLCCKLLQVPDIGKPSQMLCWWTTVHGGCARHKEKDSDPNLAACVQFKCLWLASQDHEDPSRRQARWARPDITHVIFTPDYNGEESSSLYMQVDPAYPSAWRKPPVIDFINEIIEAGATIDVIIGDTRFQLSETVQV